MALNFNPEIYRLEDKEKQERDELMRSLQLLGQGIGGYNRNKRENELADLNQAKTMLDVRNEYGTEGEADLLSSIRPKPSPLRSLFGRGEESAPVQPLPMAQPGQPGFDESAYGQRYGTKRLKMFQDREDRDLRRRKTEAEIQKLGREPNEVVNYQKAVYLDAKGRSRIGSYDPRNRQVIRDEVNDAYAPQTARGETAGNLRQEFIKRPEVEDFKKINAQVKSMDSLLERAMAGDLHGRNFLDQSLITIFNKINDPGSVVRESEYARTPEGLALSNRLSGAVEKIAQGGAGLTDQDRVDLVSAAKIIANSRGNSYAETRSGYVDLANKMTLDPSLITATMPEFSPYEVGGRSSMITVSNGSETLQIPESDEAEASADGYRRVE